MGIALIFCLVGGAPSPSTSSGMLNGGCLCRGVALLKIMSKAVSLAGYIVPDGDDFLSLLPPDCVTVLTPRLARLTPLVTVLYVPILICLRWFALSGY